VGENAAECQLVLPPPFTAARQVPDRSRREAPVPLSIPELEPDPVVDGRVDDGARSVLRVAVGPGGDEGDLRFCDLLRTGGLLVIGPPGSGRTATLDAVVGDLARVGVPVLHLATAPRPTGTQPPGVTSGELDDPAAVMRWLAARPDEPCVVCVDDLGPAGSAPALGALSQLGTATGVALLATTTSADASTWFQGPVAALRRARTGLLLRPGPGDADALGIRLPRTPLPSRPGMGWLVQAGVPERVQVARHRVRPRAAQSNSSTGPISCVAYQASS
jgi:S-DNA-T family DNA segregation ATPase FtsK/SpoIIIE